MHGHSPRLMATLFVISSIVPTVSARESEAVQGVELQPLVAQARRLVEALEFIGAPLSPAERADLELAANGEGEAASLALQAVFAPHVLVEIHINPESRVKVARGAAKPELVQHGWRSFLVRVHNEAGVTARLRVESPNSRPLHRAPSGAPEPAPPIPPSEIAQRWCDLRLFDSRPFEKGLSGLVLEYRILEVYSRDAGKREAMMSFDVGQGTQDIGFRSEASILFDCDRAVQVVLDVRDFDGADTTGSFVFRDARGRVYPSPSRRLAPDFFFHEQIYRRTGEPILLPPGTFDVEYSRGPEYLVERRKITVPAEATTHREEFPLRRWVHPKTLGWYSGDHHVHAAGCSHYDSPAQGVLPADMMRHLHGEDVNVGCVLSWGPCWYFQKQFFEGKVHEVSLPSYLMRYDVEVSGFPSSHTGHLCLLRLREDDYPGTTRIEEWPSWGMPVLRWGKSQGAVVGYSHSGWGLQVDSQELPNYEIPPFDGIGANEYIAAVTHGIVDFISAVDTPHVWELNIWYHTLNCGFRARISGETDFPCIYGERVGLGRIYCKLDGELDFDRFCDAIRDGRSYVSDGKSHILDFKVDEREIGLEESELRLDEPRRVRVSARVAAYLDPQPNPAIRARRFDQKPYWHVERARVPNTRKVPLEVIVNGESVEKREIDADGTLRDEVFEVSLSRSSWVALRIRPTSHTNPIFVIIDGKPIRASKQSAEWCRDSVARCWEKKRPQIRESERAEAEAAYAEARRTYERILSESAP
jgi:hypothetical protein